MLILQRKSGEAVQIGEDIVVSIVSVKNNRVRLSITAPEDVSILRSELIETRLTNQDSIAEDVAPEALFSLFESRRPHPEYTPD